MASTSLISIEGLRICSEVRRAVLMAVHDVDEAILLADPVWTFWSTARVASRAKPPGWVGTRAARLPSAPGEVEPALAIRHAAPLPRERPSCNTGIS